MAQHGVKESKDLDLKFASDHSDDLSTAHQILIRNGLSEVWLSN